MQKSLSCNKAIHIRNCGLQQMFKCLQFAETQDIVADAIARLCDAFLSSYTQNSWCDTYFLNYKLRDKITIPFACQVWDFILSGLLFVHINKRSSCAYDILQCFLDADTGLQVPSTLLSFLVLLFLLVLVCCYQIRNLLSLSHFITNRHQTLYTHMRQHRSQSHRDGFST